MARASWRLAIILRETTTPDAGPKSQRPVRGTHARTALTPRLSMLKNPEHERFQLGEWIVDAAGNRLQRGEETRALRHKAMALLVLLARHPGETVSRDEIVARIWDGNQFVAPKAINTAVWALRQALGDDPDSPRYLETVAKKGYRLIAPVSAITRVEETATVADPSASVPPVAAVDPAPAITPPTGPRHGPRWAAALLVTGLAALGGWAWSTLTASSSNSNTVQTPETPSHLPQAQPLSQAPGQEYLGQLSPDGSQLAFAWWQGQGVGRLYLRAAADGAAEARAISPIDEEVSGLAWAPDGQALAYVATQSSGSCTLWIYRLATQSRQALAACQALFTPSLDWSPDGRWLAFSATAEGVGGLFLIAPDGSGLRRLSSAPPAAMADHQPAWSADSRHLAFARQDPADGSRDLHELTLASGALTRLSQLKLYGLHGISYRGQGRELVFSATQQDRRMLLHWDPARATARPLGLEGSAPKRNADGSIVYALLRAHTSIARLRWGSGVPERAISSVANDRAPTAAGQGLAFVSNRTGHPEIWWADSDSAPPRRLTALEGLSSSPAVSPDASQLVFAGSCGPGKRMGLCRLELAGTTVQALTADAAEYGRASWHPGGREFVVASDRGGSWQLWRFRADGSQAPQALRTEQVPGPQVQWAADGRSLVYQARASQRLRLRSAEGQERDLPGLPPEESLVDWQLSPDGALLVLSRGSRERFRRFELGKGRQTVLSAHPLGTFPELARFSLAADGSAWVELSNTAVADLMHLR